jgi:hypothetical protein
METKTLNILPKVIFILVALVLIFSTQSDVSLLEKVKSLIINNLLIVVIIAIIIIFYLKKSGKI